MVGAVAPAALGRHLRRVGPGYVGRLGGLCRISRRPGRLRLARTRVRTTRPIPKRHLIPRPLYRISKNARRDSDVGHIERIRARQCAYAAQMSAVERVARTLEEMGAIADLRGR